MQAPDAEEILRSLGASFGRVIAQAFSNACENVWEATFSEEPGELPTDKSASVCMSFSFKGSVQGELFLIFGREHAQRLGIKGDAKDAGSFTSEHELALLTASRGSAEELRKLLFEYGDATVEIATSEVPKVLDQRLVSITLHTGKVEPSVPIFLSFSDCLVKSIQSSSPKPLSYPAPKGLTATNLGLVMDVALSVTLRFGQRRLALREVLDLTSGSVVELDRQVDEPVELVLDGRVVARGEAVIIDGNYGMRVTQVLQPIVA